MNKSRHSSVSIFLVTAQALCGVFLLLPVGVRVHVPLALMLAGVAAVLAISILIVNPPSNISPFVEPKKQGRMIVAGPYRWIRHPMYTAVLLFTLACLLVWFTPAKLIAYTVLILVLWKKMNIEESLLAKRWPEYAEYMQRSRRLIPFLY